MKTSDVRSSERPRLLLISGLSGSGKSTAAKSLEDIGYYCVDNLPLPLLRTFLHDPLALVGSYRRIAVVTDVRAPGFSETMPQLLSEIDRRRFDFTLLFLDASDEALVRRFSETRRSHPLAGGTRPLIDGIRRERELLADIRGAADLVFDSSEWSVHDFRREICAEFGDEGEGSVPLVVSLVSFGFKHGIPMGSDLIFDVRFLANPHFRPDLRDKTGRSAEVQAFLDAHDEYHDLLVKLEDFLAFVLPRYRRENRSYLSVAIGCTGGRHRSVAVCERLAERLRNRDWRIRVSHRDIDR
ncbi:MAG TPA: RNase adapter RapZ [Thermoanaerobaculia bacterium]